MQANNLQFTSYQKRVLLVLTLVNLVNWIDRQVVYPLFPLIQADFHVSYTQLGWLVAGFSVVHALGTLGLGRLADLTSRKKVISYGILFWSGATFASGLAPSFRSLLGTRALVGVGEAAYAPAATAIISGSFSSKIRARVQACFELGMFIGGASGLALGAIIAGRFGWRPAFFIVGIPGLLLALSISRLPDPPTARAETPTPLLDLLRRPAYLLMLVNGCFVAFAGYAWVIWGTDFVYHFKRFSLEQAGTRLGAILAPAGILGVLVGGTVADRLARKFAWGRVLTPAVGFLVSAPLIFQVIHARSKFALLSFLFVGAFFMTWYHGPVTAVIHDVTPAPAHATAMGIYYFFVNLFGTTGASLIVGKIADRYDLMTGMHAALAAQVIGGLGFLLIAGLVWRGKLPYGAGRGPAFPSGSGGGGE